MTMLITSGTSDYDGSGSPLVATKPVIVTFSGTKGQRTPVLTMYSRSDTAAFAPIYQIDKFRRFKVNLASGDDYYFKVNIPSNTVVDLSVVNA